jgi:hypothetical protein
VTPLINCTCASAAGAFRQFRQTIRMDFLYKFPLRILSTIRMVPLCKFQHSNKSTTIVRGYVAFTSVE